MTRSIAQNLEQINEKIEQHARIFGHRREEVTLMAVTKTVDEDRIREAIEAGIRVVGENRVQEVLRKESAFSGAELHLIGQLQSNKVRLLPRRVACIQSLDRLSLLRELERIGGREQFTFHTLVEINAGAEEQKGGILPSALEELLDAVEECRFVKVQGLMAVVPQCENIEDTRPYFRKVYNLFEKYKKIVYNNSKFEILSMGMSNDYTVALEEGSTMVRIGSAIFGKRRS